MMQTPYYAVIFTSRKKAVSEGYDQMAERMQVLSSQQEGFLGIHSARDSDGFGITVSYWKSLADIKNWKNHLEHQEAQKKGKQSWYSEYEVRVCKVERQYSFSE